MTSRRGEGRRPGSRRARRCASAISSARPRATTKADMASTRASARERRRPSARAARPRIRRQVGTPANRRSSSPKPSARSASSSTAWQCHRHPILSARASGGRHQRADKSVLLPRRRGRAAPRTHRRLQSLLSRTDRRRRLHRSRRALRVAARFCLEPDRARRSRVARVAARLSAAKGRDYAELPRNARRRLRCIGPGRLREDGRAGRRAHRKRVRASALGTLRRAFGTLRDLAVDGGAGRRASPEGLRSLGHCSRLVCS